MTSDRVWGVCVCVHVKGDEWAGRSAKLKGCGAVVEFFEAVFPRPGGPVLELALQHTLRRNPGPGQPPLPSQGHPPTRTHWEVLSTWHGRALERSQQGDETISSSHSSCRNKSGPPWHLSPPVPPAGLLATCTPCPQPGPAACSSPAHFRFQEGFRRLEARGAEWLMTVRACPWTPRQSSPTGLAALCWKLLRSWGGIWTVDRAAAGEEDAERKPQGINRETHVTTWHPRRTAQRPARRLSSPSG